MAIETKLWANSGDSHYMEPPDLYDRLPAHLRDLLPRSTRDEARGVEVITVDGQTFERPIPKPMTPERLARTAARPLDEDLDEVDRESGGNIFTRAPGAFDPVKRLQDLDDEGVWAEAIYPSLGTWTFNIRTAELVKAGCEISNDFFIDFQRHSPRYVVAASIPLLDVADAVAEIRRAAAMGFKLAFFPVRPPFGRPLWQDEEWEPVWAALEENGLVLGFHIGTEPVDPTGRIGLYYRGPAGAVLNYVETTYGGQRAVTQMIACGALDRHPGLRILVSEGGATWGPFLADRMDEGYRQHGAAVRPRLSKPPSEFLYTQVYASFQHDRSAVLAHTAMGWKNVMWGSDYPHYEGTYGHTQKTLHELFDDCDPVASRRIRIGAFQELFPHVPEPPADGAERPT
ncbi:MAG TPA: amidohydrolase family protein [Acidimicrobiales bacterium]|nr:amidohydrolase family protein [Acidimicrobiales bacterium]